MSNSDYLENHILSWISGTDMPTAPADVYVALATAAPSEASNTIAEPAASDGYTRVLVDFGAVVAGADTSSISNTIEVEFGPASADWGAISHFAIFDQASGGNMLRHAPLSAPVTINNGDSATFAVGALTIAQG
jgi:hypothetical protein